MKFPPWQLVALLMGAALAVWIYFKGKKGVTAVVEFAGTRLNPVSDQNLAYSGSNKIVQAFTDDDATLGTLIYDKTHCGDGSFNWFGFSDCDGTQAPTEKLVKPTIVP